MLRTLKFAFIPILLSALGCGKTNPASDFNNLPTRPYEAKNQSLPQQSYAPSGFLNIEVVGDSDYNFGNFFEGKPSQVKIRVTPYPGLNDYVLTVTGNPAWSQLQKSPEANIWILSGTAPVGTVPGVLSSKSFRMHFIAAPKTNDPNFSNMIGQRNIDITVIRNLGAPVITGVSGFQSTVEEGSSFNFSVEVEDTYDKSAPPEFAPAIFDPNNAENKKYFGFIQPTGITTIGSGRWSYNFTFSTGGFSLDNSQMKGSNGVHICAKFLAFKDKVSNNVSKCLTINAAVQYPEFKFDMAPLEVTPIVLTPGKLETIVFTAGVPNKKGTSVIQIQNKTDFEKWPGHPKMDSCPVNSSDPSSVTCTITWQVPCSMASKRTINFLSYNGQIGINGKAKSNKTYRDVTFNSAPAGCSDPKPAEVAPSSAPISEKKSDGPVAAAKPVKARRAKAGSGEVPKLPVATLPPADPNKPAHFLAQAAPAAAAQTQTPVKKAAKKSLAKKSIKKAQPRPEVVVQATTSGPPKVPDNMPILPSTLDNGGTPQ